ncbi:MAG: 30S ribosomal protein S20 [Oscillospiraceae bacterium]|nr:30S ribosomal protein S20 [Oscillospiraceae bacterium]
MPNIKSAKKRVSVIARKTAQNRMAKSRMRTTIKKVDALTADGEAQAAGAAYYDAQKIIDQAVAKGLLHKNTAARRKSRLAKGLKKIES